MNFEKVFASECLGMCVIKTRVAVCVRSDFPMAFEFFGSWYVWEKDFYKAVNSICAEVIA